MSKRVRAGKTLSDTTVAMGIGLVLGALTVVVLIWALVFGDVPAHPPDYALGSETVLRLERFLLALLLLGVPIVVVGLALAGSLPRKLGKDGIEWADERGPTLEGVRELRASVEALARRVERLGADQAGE